LVLLDAWRVVSQMSTFDEIKARHELHDEFQDDLGGVFRSELHNDRGDLIAMVGAIKLYAPHLLRYCEPESNQEICADHNKSVEAIWEVLKQ
jgi:hypothetical protein